MRDLISHGLKVSDLIKLTLTSRASIRRKTSVLHKVHVWSGTWAMACSTNFSQQRGESTSLLFYSKPYYHVTLYPEPRYPFQPRQKFKVPLPLYIYSQAAVRYCLRFWRLKCTKKALLGYVTCSSYSLARVIDH